MTNRRGLRGVLFDLDGTLLDTADDMAEALNCLRAAEGLESLPFDLESARYESLRTRFLDFYRAALAVHTRLFEGFDKVLDHLEQSGLRWGVVTNKPGWLTVPLEVPLPATSIINAINASRPLFPIIMRSSNPKPGGGIA